MSLKKGAVTGDLGLRWTLEMRYFDGCEDGGVHQDEGETGMILPRLSEANTERICQAFLTMEESEQSRIFDNKAFGYWEVTVERPLRLCSQLILGNVKKLRFVSGDEVLRQAFCDELGEDVLDETAEVEG